MKGKTQFLIALASMGFSVFQYIEGDTREFALYFSLGLAFAVLGLSKEDRFKKYEWLPTLSWLLIITTGIIFLFVLRTDN